MCCNTKEKGFKMKKMLIAMAIIACAAFGLLADPLVKTETVSTIWSQSVYTNYVTVDNTGIIPVGGTDVYRPVFKVAIKNNTASSASVAVAMDDLGTWTTLTGSPVTATAGAVGIGYPARLVTETSYGWVGTSSAVQAVTNSYLRPVAYMAHKIRLITTFNSTNAPSTYETAVMFQ